MATLYPIGPRILIAREASGLSLGDVAAKSGLSKGFLSRVERSFVSPSVDSLITICEVIGLPMAELFASPTFVLTRAAERPVANLPGRQVIDTLLTATTEQHVTVIETTAGPGGGGGVDLYTVPSESEVCYVVAGSLELILNTEIITLGPGDAVTFNGTTPHTWNNASLFAEVRVIWILAPALPNPWIHGAIGSETETWTTRSATGGEQTS
jgi:transcriptional regulator with XRE-family HTH domain